jgi:hypothetical protein
MKMATDGPDPTLCDRHIFEHGTAVFMTHSIPSNAMERWVQKIKQASEQPVDWHFVGGRAIVKTTGDVFKVRVAIEKLLPEHDQLYVAAVKQYDLEVGNPPRYWFDE